MLRKWSVPESLVMIATNHHRHPLGGELPGERQRRRIIRLAWELVVEANGYPLPLAHEVAPDQRIKALRMAAGQARDTVAHVLCG